VEVTGVELTGTGLLADDLWLLAHHDVTGRPFLQPRALGLGLAGALLAELVLSGRIAVRAGLVAVRDQTPARQELADAVVGLLLSEPGPLPVRDWLTVLAATTARAVPARLAAAGYLTRVSTRRPWRADRWQPVDADCAFAPLFRIRAVLDPGRTATVPGITLAGLALACGLGPRLLPYGPSGARRHLDEAIRRVAPDLRELIAHVQAAVDSAVLSQRL
jgi:hypothetical protein